MHLRVQLQPGYFVTHWLPGKQQGSHIKRRLTEIGLANLEAPASGRVEIFDSLMPGLCARIGIGRRISWSFHYRVAGRGVGGKRGQLKRISFGQYPLINLAKARELAREAYDFAEHGLDPAQQKKAIINRQGQLLLENLLPEYVELHCKPKLKNAKEVESFLRRIVLPLWRGRPLNQMTRGECIKLIDTVVAKRGTSQGNETRRHLSGLLRWAANRDYLPHNPLSGARLPALVQKARERVLDDIELRAVWDVAEKMEFPFGHYVQILILTACRRTEMAQLRYEWIKDVNRIEIIEIPAEYTKTKVVHVIPVTAGIRHVLDRIPIGLKGPYLLSTTLGDRPISGFAKILTAFRKQSEVEGWGSTICGEP